MNKIKKLIAKAELSQIQFAEKFHIPYATLNSWVRGDRTPPDYVVELLEYKIENQKFENRKKELVKLLLNTADILNKT
ncbi:MAG: helix-turn-helix transcriptional regulator [Oscillospiraceae bacterium]|nr:helix-turn-helix transcriptional regulator [Oscillospiraceae bacterium]